MTKSLKQIHSRLVKIAQDELDIANGQEAGTAGPQEVVDSLVEVIADLEDTVEVIPAEPSEPQGEELDPMATEPAPEPVVEEEDPLKPAKVKNAADDDKDDDEDKEKDAKLAQANAKIVILEAKFAKEELSKVAKDYAQTFANDTSAQQIKYDAIMKAGKSAAFWSEKLASIEEYQEANNINTTFAKPAKTESFVRQAKLGRIPVDITELSI